jgi:hypothetical protein
MYAHTWGCIHNITEGGVEVGNVDIFLALHRLFEVTVMDGCTQISKDVAGGVVVSPCLQWCASDGVQVIDDNLCHP